MIFVCSKMGETLDIICERANKRGANLIDITELRSNSFGIRIRLLRYQMMESFLGKHRERESNLWKRKSWMIETVGEGSGQKDPREKNCDFAFCMVTTWLFFPFQVH